MLLRLLREPIPDVLYSIGTVEAQVSTNQFRVCFKDTAVEIYAKESLRRGEWIRFYGSKQGNVIVCEFVQVLYNFDPALLVKCIEMLSDS